MTIENPQQYQAIDGRHAMQKFTVSIPSDVGFTDQLNQFYVLYIIGTQLKLKYFHEEIITTRNDGKIWADLKISERLACPCAIKEAPGQPKHFVNVMDNKDGVLHSNISELLSHIRDLISRLDPNSLIVFRIRGNRKILLRLINELPPSASVPFRQAFGVALAHSGFSSPFSPKSRLRVVFHIRKGDTARVEVPWHGPLTLYHDQVAISGVQTHDDVRLFRAAARKLASLFNSEDIEIIVFSDGYERSASLISSSLKNSKLFSDDRIKFIYDLLVEKERELELFSTLPHTKIFIGEDYGNFQKLLMGVQDADIVITNGTQRFVPKLIGILPDRPKMQRLIVIGADAGNNVYNTDLLVNKKNLEYIPIPWKKFSLEGIIQACSAAFKNSEPPLSNQKLLQNAFQAPQSVSEEEQNKEFLKLAKKAPSISLALGRLSEALEEIDNLKKDFSNDQSLHEIRNKIIGSFIGRH